MKRILCILLAVLMSFIFSSCKSKEENTTVNSEETQSELESTENIVESEPEETEFEITISFAGDNVLATNNEENTAGSFNRYSKENPPEYFLSKVKDIFYNDDFTVVNLENVLSDNALTPIEKEGDRAFWFKSKASNIKVLTKGGVEGVSLTNNHINDYGQQGYNDTVKTVQEAGLQYGTTNKTIYYEKEGFKIAIICSGLWSEYGASSIIKRIKTEEEQTDYQIVFFHGGTEYLHQPDEWKTKAARKLIDNGADLVVGSHPHVLQPMEEYNGKTIIYSLGNFCYGGHRKPENRTVIYQKTLTIDKETMDIKVQADNIIPCFVYTENTNNFQPTPITDEAIKQQVLDFMNQKTELPY